MASESVTGHMAEEGDGAGEGRDEVWYAAYGSNLERARLALYLCGGTHPLTGRITPGCRDGRMPAAECAFRLPFPVTFARRSEGWEGGIAFLDDSRPGFALARLWRLRTDQFADVVAQENVLPPGTIEVETIRSLGPRRRAVVTLAGGWYGKLLWCGEHGGLPIVTCSADADLGLEEPSPPSPAYLATVARGLRECGHAPEEIVEYLMAVTGVAGKWDRAAVAGLMR